MIDGSGGGVNVTCGNSGMVSKVNVEVFKKYNVVLKDLTSTKV